MKNFISTASVAAIVGLSSLVGLMPAAAAPMHQSYQQQDRYIGNYCSNNPNAGQCNDWRSNHGNWSNSQYQGFYRTHRNDRGFDSNIAAGLFGFAVGAAMMNSGSSYMSSHVRACENRYNSYSVRTDTFLGGDGMRHLCRI